MRPARDRVAQGWRLFHIFLRRPTDGYMERAQARHLGSIFFQSRGKLRHARNLVNRQRTERMPRSCRHRASALQCGYVAYDERTARRYLSRAIDFVAEKDIRSTFS